MRYLKIAEVSKKLLESTTLDEFLNPAISLTRNSYYSLKEDLPEDLLKEYPFRHLKKSFFSVENDAGVEATVRVQVSHHPYLVGDRFTVPASVLEETSKEKAVGSFVGLIRVSQDERTYRTPEGLDRNWSLVTDVSKEGDRAGIIISIFNEKGHLVDKESYNNFRYRESFVDRNSVHSDHEFPRPTDSLSICKVNEEGKKIIEAKVGEKIANAGEQSYLFLRNEYYEEHNVVRSIIFLDGKEIAVPLNSLSICNTLQSRLLADRLRSAPKFVDGLNTTPFSILRAKYGNEKKS